jgi:hypothetical protein
MLSKVCTLGSGIGLVLNFFSSSLLIASTTFTIVVQEAFMLLTSLNIPNLCDGNIKFTSSASVKETFKPFFQASATRLLSTACKSFLSLHISP